MPSAIGTESAQHCLSRDCPGEGEKRELRINSFSAEARLAPEMGTGGTWLINAAWSAARTEIGVTLKSKHRQPNE